jgi:hypothetical protein
MIEIVKIVKVEPLGGHRLRLKRTMSSVLARELTRILLAAGILLGATVPAVSQTAQEQELTKAANAALAKWQDCIIENAKRFALGRDAVGAIARVSARSCPNEKRRVVEALTHPSEPRTKSIASALADRIEKSLQQAAAEAILGLRSREDR